MKSAIVAAAASCLIGAAGIGSAAALAGGERAAWPCSQRPNEKHCKPSTETITQTLPGAVTTVTTPAATIVETLPPQVQTVTVTTPAPPAVTTTVVSTVTVRVKAKKPPAKHGTSPRHHHATKPKPKPVVHRGGGVTG